MDRSSRMAAVLLVLMATLALAQGHERVEDSRLPQLLMDDEAQLADARFMAPDSISQRSGSPSTCLTAPA